jgi:hypothetical protein
MRRVTIYTCIRLAAYSFVLGCSLIHAAFGQDQSDQHGKPKQRQGAVDRVEYAKHFLAIFYPEMEKHPFRVVIRDKTPFNLSPSLIEFALELEPPKPDERIIMGETPHPDESVFKLLPFDSGFWFNGNGQLFHYGLTADLIHLERLNKIEREISQHQEWSDDEAISFLEKSGAKYGPRQKEAFLASLPLNSLTELFGKTTIASTNFGLRQEFRSGERLSGSLTWAVYLKCGDNKHPAAIYAASFEPFEGRLVVMEKLDSLPQ